MRIGIILKLSALTYAFLLTGILAKYGHIDKLDIFELLVMTVSLFLPVLLTLRYKKIACLGITSFCMFGSLASFVVIGQSNIWPIALIFWFITLLPGALLINITTIIIKKHIKTHSDKS